MGENRNLSHYWALTINNFMFERMHIPRLERDKQIFLTRIPLRDGFVGPHVARLAHMDAGLNQATGTHRRTRAVVQGPVHYADEHFLTSNVSMEMPQSPEAAPRRYQGSPAAHSRSGTGGEDVENGGQLLTGTAAPRTPPAGPGLGLRSSD